MSLLAAFVAILGKQWLNRYLRHTGGSTIERCGDRQRKLGGLKKWPLDTFVESLPVMLQIALLLACGLCRHAISIFDVLITFTGLGSLFYLGIVIFGPSSYECPFQTPASTHSEIYGGRSDLSKLRKSIWSKILHAAPRSGVLMEILLLLRSFCT